MGKLKLDDITLTTPTTDPQDPGFDVEINYVATRSPTTSEPLVYNNLPFLMLWWQNATSSDDWATYATNSLWWCANNTVDNQVWWQMVFDANILSILANVGWQINTARNYAASGISLNAPRQASLTNDIFVAASLNLVNTSSTNITVTAEISPDDSTWTTVGQISDTPSVDTNTTSMISFVVPQGYYYRLVGSGTGTIVLVSCQELYF